MLHRTRLPRPALFLLLAFLVLLAGCASTRKEEGFYAPKQPKFRIETDKQGRKHGQETWWHPNGQVKYQAVNAHGRREGRFTAWHPSGAKWYEGWEQNGKPESTLTYWYPNGNMKSRSLYRDGIQLEREDWAEDGRPLFARPPAPAAAVEAPAPAGAAAAERETALRLWAMRVRQTVESYWRVPKALAKDKPHQAVAAIRVDREGRILKVTWRKRSASADFNALAQQTFRKIKRLPPFPPQIQEEFLDIQYEFLSQGKAAPRRKLELRAPAGGSMEEEVVPSPSAAEE